MGCTEPPQALPSVPARTQLPYLAQDPDRHIVQVSTLLCPVHIPMALLSRRYVLLDIIGQDNGFGVENLQAAGTIAGESSRAYDEIVTISMVQPQACPCSGLPSLLLDFKVPPCVPVCTQVTCRAIGIGAYLVRLGQRVIQVENSHIILTGVTALNKVPSSGCVSSLALSLMPCARAPSLSHGKRWQFFACHLMGPVWRGHGGTATENHQNSPPTAIWCFLRGQFMVHRS